MWALYRRDVLLSVRAGGGALVGLLFFLSVVAVVPFGVGPDLALAIVENESLECLASRDRAGNPETQPGAPSVALAPIYSRAIGTVANIVQTLASDVRVAPVPTGSWS